VPEPIASQRIAGVYLIRLGDRPDDRGRFLEVFRRSWVPGSREMVQANRSDSRAGVLRGMHYHLFQADFWHVAAGRIFTALFDLRTSSPTRGRAETLEMGEGDDMGVFIPPGVAHGFYALTDATLIYLVDQYFDGSDEFGVRYEDPAMGIEWPGEVRSVSERDRTNPLLSDIPESDLPA
jgi:dTDP-4-dehydrorhamnose 3,5-epimerase